MIYTINFILAEDEKAYLTEDTDSIEFVESRSLRNEYGEVVRFMYDIYTAYVKEIEHLVWIDSNNVHWIPDIYEVCENNIVFIHTWKQKEVAYA